MRDDSGSYTRPPHPRGCPCLRPVPARSTLLPTRSCARLSLVTITGAAIAQELTWIDCGETGQLHDHVERVPICRWWAIDPVAGAPTRLHLRQRQVHDHDLSPAHRRRLDCSSVQPWRTFGLFFPSVPLVVRAIPRRVYCERLSAAFQAKMALIWRACCSTKVTR